LLATVSGAVVAGKGKRPFKRTLYALVFGTTATAACYPYRALEVAETGYHHTASSISQLYSSITSSSAVENVAKEEVNKVEDIVVENISLSEAVKDVVTKDAGNDLETTPTVSEIVKDSEAEDPVMEAVSLSEAVKDIEVVAAVEPTTEEAKPEYNPNQTELVEITVIPIDSEETPDADVKDVTLELVDNIAVEEEYVVVEGDLGQSDPEDQDMYSTRS